MKIINKLPERFQWTIHNMIAHPIMEVLYQFGFDQLSAKVHDCTVPHQHDDDQNDNNEGQISK
jgi:hypothetical protein